MNLTERISQWNREIHSMVGTFDLESIDHNSLNDIQNEKATRQLGGLFFKGE
jgi:hypothetical protein